VFGAQLVENGLADHRVVLHQQQPHRAILLRPDRRGPDLRIESIQRP
jgi:hypothetical protein